MSQETKAANSGSATKGLTLVRATMCEDIINQTPKNTAVAFSIQLQNVYCFTLFDSIPQKTFIHHNWYRGERLSTKLKLRLRPPRWATFSRIQLRESDKGPWRVEIADQNGNILKILRFSITN